MVGPDEFRDAARLFASGVTVVTVSFNGEIHGMTAISFAAISLDPPLILISLEKTSHTRELVLASGHFVVNVLREDQEAIAKRFSMAGKKDFSPIPHRSGADGSPVFTEASAVFSCRTIAVHDGGDHDIFLAEVEATEVRDGKPLIYFDRDYRRLG